MKKKTGPKGQRIRCSAQVTNDNNTVRYYLPVAAIKDKAILIGKKADIDDYSINPQLREMLAEILAVEGVKSLRLDDDSIAVTKPTVFDWLEDGIHEAISAILKKHLFKKGSGEILPLPGKGFATSRPGQASMKPRIKYKTNYSGRENRICYFVQEIITSTDVEISVRHETELVSTRITEIGKTITGRILEIPGVSKVYLNRSNITVQKITAAEWDEDGIHQAVIDCLKAVLYPYAEPEIIFIPEEKGQAQASGLEPGLVSGLVSYWPKESRPK